MPAVYLFKVSNKLILLMLIHYLSHNYNISLHLYKLLTLTWVFFSAHKSPQHELSPGNYGNLSPGSHGNLSPGNHGNLSPGNYGNLGKRQVSVPSDLDHEYDDDFEEPEEEGL